VFERTRFLASMLRVAPRLLAYRPNARTSVADLVESRARRHPRRTFVRFEDRAWSYAELNEAANRVAHWGASIGLAHRDVVALLMENRPEYVAAWLGLAKLGVTTALINTNLTGAALRHALETANASHLILGSECVDRFSTAEGSCEPPLEVWLDRDPSALEPTHATPRGSHDLGAALDAQSERNPDPAARADLVCGDDLFYIYTSGTTGLPKAARFSHLRFLATGGLTAALMGLQHGDVHYCALPLYHSAGGMMLVSTVLASGATMALRRKFSASHFWDDIRRFEATAFQYIGEFCRYLMNVPERQSDRHHSVRAIVGNGLRPDIWQDFQRRFAIPQIFEFYGATEANTVILNFENKVGSVGRFPIAALSNARLVRFDLEADEHPRDARGCCIECGPGEAGELIARIPANENSAVGRFEGYTSERATQEKILRDVFEAGDAWFRSGDLLRQDEEGFFYFVDRIGDTFRWKGENVSTQEVAELLGRFPGIAIANVYGVEVAGADGRAGMAALLLRNPASLDGSELYRHASESLPPYAVPVFVRLLCEVDVTSTFKLRKVALQEEGYDVERVEDPIYFRDDAAKCYTPLSPELLAEIRSGARKL
jgi:fatty-acyl-CoA synthase